MTQPSAATEPWTINRLLAWTAQFLAKAGLETPRLCAEILLAHALGCTKIELYTRSECVPDEPALTTFRESVRRAGQHFPIAYLVGYREFYSLKMKVSPAVLIPRPETELLVERAIAASRQPWEGQVQVWDVGTGSGCVAIALAKNLPAARVVGSDVSTEALEIARQNVEQHAVADRVMLMQADRLALPPEQIPPGGFELIVSNPPYLSDDEVAGLEPAVRDHEPHEALSAGSDAVAFYRCLAQEAPAFLQPAGRVLVEIGAGMLGRVTAAMTADGRLGHSGTWRDTGGGHDRVVEFAATNG